MADGFEIDLDEVFKGIDFVSVRVQQGAERGMVRVMTDLERESNRLAPKLSGELRASSRFEVETKQGSVTGTLTYLATKTNGRGWAYNYALRLHEFPRGFSNPSTAGTKPKFLSKPLKARSEMYQQWIAEEIRKELE